MMRSGVAREQLDEGTTYGQWHEFLHSEVPRVPTDGADARVFWKPPLQPQDSSSIDFREYILCFDYASLHNATAAAR
jgi:hypothetical protein